ncbi:unnamed protein product [Pseudo-nitzschia multistriata]|uniref:L domain-like protein n=1 Tax=Pseudo-nitzschia multistriata TaxID=183589 RepID=A0A448Z5R9_9STRA|nr:unnamed protein product [Pseudo-nitzschia multistriata]
MSEEKKGQESSGQDGKILMTEEDFDVESSGDRFDTGAECPTDKVEGPTSLAVTPEALVTVSTTNGSKEQYLAEAMRVDRDKIVVATEVNDDEEPKSKSYTKRLIAIAVVGVIAIVIVLIINFTIGKKQKPNNEPTDPTISDSITTPEESNLSIEKYSERRSSLIEILTPLVSDPEVFNPESPQASPDRIEALEWLVTSNPARFSILGLKEHSSNTTYNHSLEEQSETNSDTVVQQIRQHFVLALFYFATNGPNWEEQYRFLSDLDPCLWNTFRSTATEEDEFYVPKEVDARGIICNTQGRVSFMHMWWNDLSGTLPPELSYFKDSLREINLAGGSISGSIPDFTDLEKLEILAVNDNCLTGRIPEGFSDLPNLYIFNTYGNAGLVGSLNEFCNGTAYQYKNEVTAFVSADYCGNYGGLSSSGVECNCCVCCNPNNFECYSQEWGLASTVFSQIKRKNKYAKSFEKSCLTFEHKQWVEEECPCLVESHTLGNDDSPYYACSNCTVDGVRPSHPNWDD